MDWSLVLASQEIACAIHGPMAGMGWSLEVAAEDVAPALQALRRFVVENRGWRAPLVPTSSGLLFHAGAFLWCFLLIVIHWAAEAPGSIVSSVGTFSTRAAAAGDWWRPLTATFLHGGLDHLAANLTTGFLLLGLAIGRFGAGPALLLGLLAGVGGNLLAWTLRVRDYTGLGASGVVMGTLGMLAFSLLADARHGRADRALVIRSLLGGAFLFILFGTSPNSDVLAHAGGFVCGGILAAVHALLPARWAGSRSFDVGTAAVYLGLGMAAWGRALAGS